MDTRYHRVQWGPDGTRSRTKTWGQPLGWDREAAKAGRKAKVFCASLADVFEDRPELVPWRADLFRLIDRCQNLYWMLLTKRPENVRRMWPGVGFPDAGIPGTLGRSLRLENVWLGTSIANQHNADEFVPRLLELRDLAPVLFLSIEPQIGPVDLNRWLWEFDPAVSSEMAACLETPTRNLDWVIVGGESRQGGPPRPFNIGWARTLIDQCFAAGVPCFVKQLGSDPRDERGGIIDLKDTHGGDWNEWFRDLRVRQCPERSFFGMPAQV